MTAGVYAIVNTANGRVYIGSSHDIERRWKIRQRRLYHGYGENQALVADWRNARGQGFELQILQATSRDESAMTEAEQRWLNQYRGNCYNVRLRVWRASDPARSRRRPTTTSEPTS